RDGEAAVQGDRTRGGAGIPRLPRLWQVGAPAPGFERTLLRCVPATRSRESPGLAGSPGGARATTREQPHRSNARAPFHLEGGADSPSEYAPLRLPAPRRSDPREGVHRVARRPRPADAAHPRTGCGMRSTAVVRVAGETLRLLPERAILWEETQTLLLADT